MVLGLDSGHGGDINSAFFQFQREGGWDTYLRNKPHFKLFSNLANQLYDRKCGVPGLRETIQEAVRESDGELSMAEDVAAVRSPGLRYSATVTATPCTTTLNQLIARGQ